MWGEQDRQTQADLGHEIHPVLVLVSTTGVWQSRGSLPFELASFRFVLPIACSPAAASSKGDPTGLSCLPAFSRALSK